MKNENNKIMNENASLIIKIRELEHIIQAKTKDSMDKQKKILDLETVNITLKSEQLNLNEVIRHRDELTNKFNRVMEINYNLNEDISKLNKSFLERLRLINDKSEIYEKENSKLRNDFEKKRKESLEKDGIITGIY
jgi:hypothetical protein